MIEALTNGSLSYKRESKKQHHCHCLQAILVHSKYKLQLLFSVREEDLKFKFKSKPKLLTPARKLEPFQR
jgi:hypothetical protein